MFKIVRRWFILLGMLIIGLVFIAPAGAVLAEGTVVTTDSNSLSQVKISALVVTMVISLFIPFINGLLTKANSKIKGLVTIVLNAISALVVTATMADGTAVISKETFVITVMGVLVSVGTYLQVYKPLGITSSPVIQSDGTLVDGKLANVGIK